MTQWGGGGDFGNIDTFKINISGTPKVLEICLQCFGILYYLFEI